MTGIWLEWRAIGDPVFMGDRVMEVVAEKGLVPDLAEAPPIAGNDPLEAVIGKRNVMAIIHRVQRAAPNHVIPTIAQVTNALYGSVGVNDYYGVVSGGRFSLNDAGVFSVPALKTEAHYWNHDDFDCDGSTPDGFTGGHVERWVEAIEGVDAAVDFSTFDTDGDGTVQPSELAILIVVPQGARDGFYRALDPNCNGNPFEIDGVVIPRISEWFTSNPEGSWEVAAHELAHQVLNLGDMYSDAIDFDTEAGTLSLMGDNFFTTTHIDGVAKLALGWATPPLRAPSTGTSRSST